MEIQRQWCDQESCPDFGKIGTSNVRIYSHAERRFYCTTCNHTFCADKEHSLKLCEPRRTYFWMQWLCWLSATVCVLSAGSSNLNPIPFFTGWTWLVSTLLLLANISFEVFI